MIVMINASSQNYVHECGKYHEHAIKAQKFTFFDGHDKKHHDSDEVAG